MSRKKAGKPKKAAPIKLAWQDQIIAAKWPEKPARTSVYAVAMMLASFADRDGSGACPAVATIASKLRVKRQTVCDVLGIMVEGGHLTKTGRTAYGTVIYSLCLTRHTESTAGMPHAVSPRGTQLPTLDRKGEGGGGNAPFGDTPTAVASGQDADRIIAEFRSAFETRFATRSNDKPIEPRRLEPSNQLLRQQIITKIDAGWPQDHLIDRVLNLINHDKPIGSLTGLVRHHLSQLPDQPDYDAHLITDQGVKAMATAMLKEAERKQAQQDQSANDVRERRSRRNRAIKRFSHNLKVYGVFDDHEAGMAQLIAEYDSEAQYESKPELREAWPLSDQWIEEVLGETEEYRDAWKAQRQEINQLMGDARHTLATHRLDPQLIDSWIDEALTAAGLDRESIYAIRHRDAAIATLRALTDRNQPAELTDGGIW